MIEGGSSASHVAAPAPTQMRSRALTRQAWVGTVLAERYSVRVPEGLPAAVLANRVGWAWSRVSRLASVDRTDVPRRWLNEMFTASH